MGELAAQRSTRLAPDSASAGRGPLGQITSSVSAGAAIRVWPRGPAMHAARKRLELSTCDRLLERRAVSGYGLAAAAGGRATSVACAAASRSDPLAFAASNTSRARRPGLGVALARFRTRASLDLLTCSRPL